MSEERRSISNPDELPLNMMLTIGDQYVDVTIDAIFNENKDYMGPMTSLSFVTEKIQKVTQDNMRRERERAKALQSKVDELLYVVNAAAAGATAYG